MLNEIKALCKKNGTNIKTVEERLGFGQNTMFRWDSKKPSIDKVVAVADHFGVTLDEVVGRKASSMSDAELSILSYFRELNEDGQAKLLNEAEFLSRQPEYIKSDIREIEA